MAIHFKEKKGYHQAFRSDQFITKVNLVISADIHISPIYQWVWIWKINASSNVTIFYGSYGMDKSALDV
jgi:hypothetical protein